MDDIVQVNAGKVIQTCIVILLYDFIYDRFFIRSVYFADSQAWSCAAASIPRTIGMLQNVSILLFVGLSLCCHWIGGQTFMAFPINPLVCVSSYFILFCFR